MGWPASAANRSTTATPMTAGMATRRGSRRAHTTPTPQTTAHAAKRTSRAHRSLRSGSEVAKERLSPTPAMAVATKPGAAHRGVSVALWGTGEVGHAGGEVHRGDEAERLRGPGGGGDDVAAVAQPPLAGDDRLEARPGQGA